MSAVLALEYSANFKKKFFEFKFSGDSGRSSAQIRPQPRRPIQAHMKRVFVRSKACAELADRLAYSMQL
jgi:hypothetical protein